MSAPTGVHPYAATFPMLPDAELDELAASIVSNGLRSPVVVTPGGEVLDGRNRVEACRRAGVEPDTVVYEGGDLAEYVIDCNVTRRNMSTGARAMATALVLAADGRRGDGRWKRGTVVGSHESVTTDRSWQQRMIEAGVILDHAPDLAEQVVSGDLALDGAFRQAQERQKAERDRLDAAEREQAEEDEARAFVTDHAPDLAEQVGDGKPFRTFTEARDVWNRRNREEAERLRAERAAVARREQERLDGLRHTYKRMADALLTTRSWGQHPEPLKVMDDFDPALLPSPQDAREFTPDSINSGLRFLTALAEWAEARQ